VRAVFIRRYGGVDVLEVGERPRPEPGPGQVLIEVHAAGVNPRDWLLREGRYQFRWLLPSFPIVLGSDVSGAVAGLGPGATRFSLGEAVFGMQTALGRMGGYAEYAVIAEKALARKPPSVSHEEAAAAPCAALTAWQSLHAIGRVEPGRRVTIAGASGGVGSYAVQLARAAGARVTAVTSGANEALARELGAEAFVDYTQGPWTGRVRDQDIVLDAVGRTPFAAARSSLARGGRYVTTVPRTATFAVAAGSRLLRAATGRRRPSAHIVLVGARGADLESIATLMAEGRVRSILDGVYPLEGVREAHARSRTWRTRGKLVLRVR